MTWASLSVTRGDCVSSRADQELMLPVMLLSVMPDRHDMPLSLPVCLSLAQCMFCHLANGRWQCHANIIVVNTPSFVKQHRSWLDAALGES